MVYGPVKLSVLGSGECSRDWMLFYSFANASKDEFYQSEDGRGGHISATSRHTTIPLCATHVS